MTILNMIGGGNGGALNIYVQPTEPEKKEGIWLQSSTLEANSQVIYDDSVYKPNEWVAGETFIPRPNKLGNAGCAVYGDEIFCAGGGTKNGDGYGMNFLDIYNVKTNTWRSGPKSPGTTLVNPGTALVGTKIYFMSWLANSALDKSIISYDILTNTWTTESSWKDNNYGVGCVAYGDKIYKVGGTMINYNPQRSLSCYDTRTKTFSSCVAAPESLYEGMFADCKAVLVDSTIYVISSTYNSDWGKYDILTNTWTVFKPSQTNVNTSVADGAVLAIGKKIYFFRGGSPWAPQAAYYTVSVYDLESNAWSEFSKLPIKMSQFCVGTIGNRIYCLDGNDRTGSICCFSLNGKTYLEDTFILKRSNNVYGMYFTELVSPKKPLPGPFTRAVTGFDDAWKFHNGMVQSYPAYYGDGAKWIKYK